MISYANMFSLLNTCVRSLVPIVLIPMIFAHFGDKSVTIWVKTLFTLMLIVTFDQAIYPLLVRSRIRSEENVDSILAFSFLLGLSISTLLALYSRLALQNYMLLIIILCFVSYGNHMKAHLEAQGNIKKIRVIEFTASVYQVLYWICMIMYTEADIVLICLSGFVVYYFAVSFLISIVGIKGSFSIPLNVKLRPDILKLFAGQITSLIFINILYLELILTVEASYANTEEAGMLSAFIYILRNIGFLGLIPLYNAFQKISTGQIEKPLWTFGTRMFFIYFASITFITILHYVSDYHIFDTHIYSIHNTYILVLLISLIFFERMFAIFNHIKCLCVHEDTGRNYFVLLAVVICLSISNFELIYFCFTITSAIIINLLIQSRRYGDF